MQHPRTRPVAVDDLTRMVRDAHARTMALIAGLAPEQLIGPRLPIVNPMLWEIGHVAWFHEYFVLRGLDGRAPLIDRADSLYDSMKVAHATRWDLDLPGLAATIRYREAVRDALIARLGGGAQGRMASERDSYFTQLTVFHEDMHDEAFTYTRQTLGYPVPAIVDRTARAAADSAGPLPGDVAIPAQAHRLGAEPTDPYYMDNEKWAHDVDVAAFRIARAPVTNAEFRDFVEDRGYARAALWSDDGWRWRQAAGAEHPVYWINDGAGWKVREFDRIVGLRPHAPVAHVNWFEAEAWCRWAGRRLPTEAEWEVAAASTDANPSSAGRRYPWGDDAPTAAHANLDGRNGGTVDVAAFRDGDSAWGCRQMIGNVWEWTSSPFLPYPGFAPDPYADYSQPWFGPDRMVLRGGSWATRGRIVWTRWRNFFPRDRRDIVAGFRSCAV